MARFLLSDAITSILGELIYLSLAHLVKESAGQTTRE